MAKQHYLERFAVARRRSTKGDLPERLLHSMTAARHRRLRWLLLAAQDDRLLLVAADDEGLPLAAAERNRLWLVADGQWLPQNRDNAAR